MISYVLHDVVKWKWKEKKRQLCDQLEVILDIVGGTKMIRGEQNKPNMGEKGENWKTCEGQKRYLTCNLHGVAP